MDQDPGDDPGRCPDRSGTIAIYHSTISCISHGWRHGTFFPFPLSPLFPDRCILFRKIWKSCEVLIVGSSRCNSDPTHLPLHTNRYGYDLFLHAFNFYDFLLKRCYRLTLCFTFLDTHCTA